MTTLRHKRWIHIGPLGIGVSVPAAVDQRAAGISTSDYPPGRDVPMRTPSEKSQTRFSDPDAALIQRRVDAIEWYHTIDLGSEVATNGLVDHRGQVAMYQIPESLEGLRCLDVASMDGFWAFEMEKRGAGEVVATDVARLSDLDMPPRVREELIRSGRDGPASPGFGLAHDILGSKVEKRIVSAYQLSPALVGEFDLVFLGDRFLQLRDPQLALERVRSVCRGSAYVAALCHPDLEAFDDLCLAEYPAWVPGEYAWWRLNVNTLKRMLAVAGFETVEELSRFRLNVPGAAASSLPMKVVLRGVVSDQRARRAPNRALVELRRTTAASVN